MAGKMASASPQISPGGNQSVDSGNSSGKHTGLDTSSDSDPNDPKRARGPRQAPASSKPSLQLQNSDLSANQNYGTKTPVSHAHVANHGPPATQVTHPSQQTQQLSTSIDLQTPNMEVVRILKEHWYRPNLSRDEAIKILKTAPFGSFVIRDSTSYKGGYGLALRIEQLTDKIKKGFSEKTDVLAEHVRHYWWWELGNS